MAKKTIILASVIGGVGLFAYSIYRYIKVQTALLEQFTYKITGFNIDKIDPSIIKGKMSVLFTSSADVEVTIKEFYLDFYFNGKRVGYIQDLTEFVIPARGSSNIPFEWTINPSLIFSNVFDIVEYSLKQKDADIEVIGYATLKSGFIKVTLPIQYATTIKELLS